MRGDRPARSPSGTIGRRHARSDPWKTRGEPPADSWGGSGPTWFGGWRGSGARILPVRVDDDLTRAAGVQSEMEIAFAGLHQLCGPMLHRLDRLPGPQRDGARHRVRAG